MRGAAATSLTGGSRTRHGASLSQINACPRRAGGVRRHGARPAPCARVRVSAAAQAGNGQPRPVDGETGAGLDGETGAGLDGETGAGLDGETGAGLGNRGDKNG